MRLICQLCEGRRVLGQDAIHAHVQMHHGLGDDVQVWWATPNGLVLKRRAPEYYDVDVVLDGDIIAYERVPKEPAFHPVYDVHPLEGPVLAQLVCLYCGRRFAPRAHELRRRHADEHARGG